MAADDPARGSNRGDIKSRATHVDTFGDALSDEGSIPSASTSSIESRSVSGSALDVYPISARASRRGRSIKRIHAEVPELNPLPAKDVLR